jgi:hypothetical protein
MWRRLVILVSVCVLGVLLVAGWLWHDIRQAASRAGRIEEQRQDAIDRKLYADGRQAASEVATQASSPAPQSANILTDLPQISIEPPDFESADDNQSGVRTWTVYFRSIQGFQPFIIVRCEHDAAPFAKIIEHWDAGLSTIGHKILTRHVQGESVLHETENTKRGQELYTIWLLRKQGDHVITTSATMLKAQKDLIGERMLNAVKSVKIVDPALHKAKELDPSPQ